MKRLTIERFECPNCHAPREVESIGHAVTVPCQKCGKPMRKTDVKQAEFKGVSQ